MAIDQTNEEQLKKDLNEKLFKFLSEPPKVYHTYTGPIHPTTDEEFIKVMYEKIFDYYKQWKTGSSSDKVLDALLKKLKESSTKGTNDKTNSKLLLQDLVNLSINRIDHLEELLEKKIELIQSI